MTVLAPQRMSDAEIADLLERERDWVDRVRRRRMAVPALPALTRADVAALRARASVELPALARALAPAVDASFRSVTIRSQRTRWGSCSAKGALSFNCLLMLAPEEVRRYVVAHELCHLRHMNHSPAFWAEVARVMPEWRGARAWLRTNGPSLIARLPERGPLP